MMVLIKSMWKCSSVKYLLNSLNTVYISFGNETSVIGCGKRDTFTLLPVMLLQFTRVHSKRIYDILFQMTKIKNQGK